MTCLFNGRRLLIEQLMQCIVQCTLILIVVVGCKHRASEGVIYLGCRGYVICALRVYISIAEYRSLRIFRYKYIETFRTFTAGRIYGLNR